MRTILSLYQIKPRSRINPKSFSNNKNIFSLCLGCSLDVGRSMSANTECKTHTSPLHLVSACFCRSRSTKVALIVSFIYFLFHCANRSHNCLINSHTPLRRTNSPRACQTVLGIRSKGRVHHCSKFCFFLKILFHL